MNRIRESEMERAYLIQIGTDRWGQTEGAVKEMYEREGQREIGMEGWMDGGKKGASDGGISQYL